MSDSVVLDKKNLQQLEKQFEDFKSAPKYSLHSDELFCTCRKPDNGELMVACDGCDEWFHFKCMDLDKKNKDLVKSFYCKFCDLLHHKGKSVWKRKCKIVDCYKPIEHKSQFCSSAHAIKYWSSFLDTFDEHSNNPIDSITKSEIANVLRSINTLDDLLKVGDELPVFDKGELQITDEQKSEIESNENAIKGFNSNIENLNLKVKYLYKLKSIISQLNELLTTSLDPDNKEDTQINDEPLEPKKKKSKKNRKQKHFKVDICGFDKRLLLDDKDWKKFTESTTFGDIMKFESLKEDNKKEIIEIYQLLKLNGDESDKGFNTNLVETSKFIISKLCLRKKKCNLHDLWFQITSDTLDMKINEQYVEIEKKTTDNENLKKFIQIKNWKRYCNE